MEHKTFRIKDLEIKQTAEPTANNEGHFTGYLAVFNNTDEYNDIIQKGAFKKTLKDNKGKVWLLNGHNPDDRIGYLILEEDDFGLKVIDGVLNLATNKGKEIYEEMKFYAKAGLNLGLSIGYRVIKFAEKIDNAILKRIIQEIKLYEGSLVTFPANELALVSSVKNYNPDLAELKKLIREEVKSLLQERTAKADNNIDTKQLKELFSFLKTDV